MDLSVTGKFISEERKAKGLTQVKLAEKLNVSEKTISKWECGNGFPDTTLILPLCKELGITANELLSGKRLKSSEDYKSNAEDNLLKLMQEKKNVKKKITIAFLVVIISMISCISLFVIIEYLNLALWIKILLGVVGILILLTGAIIACLVDNEYGSFECSHCGKRFVPTNIAYIMGAHTITTRRLKCPHCGKKSYCKRRLSNKND